MEAEKPEYDRNLYSRQEITYGVETMRKLVKLRVLVVGLSGLGIEVAKNLILAGPAKVALCDPRPVRPEDAEFNFYHHAAKGEHGTRADSILKDMAELNSHVKVEALRAKGFDDLLQNKALVGEFDILVVCDFFSFDFVVQLNHLLREQGKKLVVAVGFGLAGFVFDDFGPAHKVSDKNGENARHSLISMVGEDGVVTTHEDSRHDFEVGDLVRFSEVVGMEKLNGQVLKITEVPTAFTFKVGPLDAATYGKYVRNGQVEEVKALLDLAFVPLPQALQAEALPDCDLDFANVERLNAMKLFVCEMWRLLPAHDFLDCRPRYGDMQTFQAALKAAAEVAGREADADKKANLMKFLESEIPKFLLGLGHAQLSPVSSFFGGIAAQEVIKVTGKYTPIRQWFFHEFYSTVFKGRSYSSPAPIAGRHEGQTSVFGQQVQQAIESANVLMVGAGALGCELLKMFALMGLGCGKGAVTCTDDDVIEVSNLNRQFLFRSQHIGQSKSKTAVEAARRMNAALNATALKERVAASTEAVFTDEFWDNLTFIVNAVDNVQARQYIDQKAVFHFKQLFDSGTLGTKCNTQQIIPDVTEAYSDSVDPPEKTFPMCTLRSFPYLIEHVIEWARASFNEVFVTPAKFFADFFAYPDKQLKECIAELKDNPVKYRELSESLEFYLPLLEDPSPLSYVRFARDFFTLHFDSRIFQLISLFPADYKDKDGRLFWSSPKRPPTPLRFDPAAHEQFIYTTVHVLQQVLRPAKPFELTHQQVRELLAQLPPPPKATVNEADREKLTAKQPAEAGAGTDIDAIKNTLKRLHDLAPRVAKQLVPAELEFEKDVDANGHIDFITAITNFRATNYNIPCAERHKVKFIAGRIVPAIATSTAMVVGAVGIEIYKFFARAPADQYRNFFSNLALPIFNFSETLPPVVQRDKQHDPILLGPVKALPPKYNTWSRTELRGPLTVQQVADKIKELYKFNLSSVMCGKTVIWNNYGSGMEALKSKTIEKIAEENKIERTKGKKYLCLAIGGETDDMVDVVSPYIKYTLG